MKKIKYLILFVLVFVFFPLICNAKNSSSSPVKTVYGTYLGTVKETGGSRYFAVLDSTSTFGYGSCGKSKGTWTDTMGTTDTSDDVDRKFCERKAGDGKYYKFVQLSYSKVSIRIEDHTLNGYCIDPSVYTPDAKGVSNMTCDQYPIDSEARGALAFLILSMNDTTVETWSRTHNVDALTLAIRYYATKAGLSHTMNAAAKAIGNLNITTDNKDASNKISLYDAAVHYKSSSYKTDEAWTTLMSIIDNAKSHANEYIINDDTSNDSKTDTSSTHVDLLSLDNSTGKAQLDVYMDAHYTPTFSCDNCHIDKETPLSKDGTLHYIIDLTVSFGVDALFHYAAVSDVDSAKKSVALYHCYVPQATNIQSFLVVDDHAVSELYGSYPFHITPSETEHCPDDVDEEKSGYMCCEDSTSAYYKESLIDSLFCDTVTNSIKVTGNKVKNDSFPYDSQTINSYCTLYCNERINFIVPAGGSTSRNGKYFDFEPAVNSDGVYSKGPYFTGYKTCRVVTDYETIQSKYVSNTNNAVQKYNDYLSAQAKADSYAEAQNYFDSLSSNNKSGTIKRTVTYKGSKKGTHCTAECTTKETYDCTFYYKYKPSEYTYKSYYFYKVRADYPDGSAVNNFSGVGIEEYAKDSSVAGWTGTGYYSPSWADSKCGKGSDTKTTSCTCDYDYECTKYSTSVVNGKNVTTPYKSTCTTSETVTGVTAYYYSISDDSIPDDTSSFQKAVTDAATAASTANADYKTYADAINTLESDLDTCNNYFTKGNGNASSNYALNASANFKYTQVYVNNSTNLIESKDTPVAFNSNCISNAAVVGSDDDVDNLGSSLGLNDPQYNEWNGNETASVINFKAGNASHSYDSNRINNALSSNISDRTFEQKYVTDAYYFAECTTNEDETKYYTLYPYGSFSTTKTTYSVVNSKKYYTEYTSLSGKFLTIWEFSGLGTNGKFDKYFKSGTVCSGEDISSVTSQAGYSCSYQVDSELTKLQGCGSDTTSKNNYVSHCCTGGSCSYNGDDVLAYTFKIVDSTNLFPACTALANNTSVSDDQFNNCFNITKYGYNWLQVSNGKTVLNEIQKSAVADTTYAEDHATYTIYLSESDLTKIKKYNSNQSQSYSDFNMTCKCAGGADVSECSTHLYGCQSKFLNDIYDGSLSGVSGNLSVTGRLSELNTLRNNANSHVHIAS